jgi:hypothetical protein
MARVVSCRWISLLLLLMPASASAAMSEEEMFFKSVSEVNDGDLTFLTQAPAQPVHHHQNRITLSKTSLSDGWVLLEQCHHHLDPVPDMQIVYGQDRIRNLVILSSENISRTWVHGHTVQMQQVERDASICIRAETLALKPDGDRRYVLINGPYMRRFLDGYYPMRVSLNVVMEAANLQFADIEPPPQDGFNLNRSAREIGYDAYFEGELRTRIGFTLDPDEGG